LPLAACSGFASNELYRQDIKGSSMEQNQSDPSITNEMSLISEEILEVCLLLPTSQVMQLVHLSNVHQVTVGHMLRVLVSKFLEYQLLEEKSEKSF
jgi:hypothetical protein